MQTKNTDVCTDDARPLLSTDMTIAAGWLARAANQLAIAECNSVVPGDPDAVRAAVDLSKTYAMHAMAIVLGEVDPRSQPRPSPVRTDDTPTCNVCGKDATTAGDAHGRAVDLRVVLTRAAPRLNMPLAAARTLTVP